MRLNTSRTKGLLVALLLLATIVPITLLDAGTASECVPPCDDCHAYHDRVYWAFLDITQFRAPTTLDGAERKVVEVQLRLHGNVGLGYTTIRRGWLELTSNNNRVAVEDERKEFISYEPGFRSFFWNVSGRLEGVDTLHIEVYALGVHLSVEFFEGADSETITVTNPINAPPLVSFAQPDGRADVADNSYTIELDIDEPNADPLLADFYYDDDQNRSNGQTLIRRLVIDPQTFVWDTSGLATGWYWLHVDVDDQRGGTDSATSEHPVIVSHGNRVPHTDLVTPNDKAIAYYPTVTFTWQSQDGDGDALTYEIWMGRDLDHLELVGTTQELAFDYEPVDNARLFWTVIPNDGKVRGWCRNGPWTFTTRIDYPVEVDLILPADGAIVPGPDVKLVWYGRDRDYEQILYDVWLEVDGEATRVVNDWDDPAGPVLTLPDLVPGETYTWWVEGDNPYSPKGVTEPWTFTVAQGGLPSVDLDGEDLTEGAANLSWSPSTVAPPPASYDVHLVDPVHGDRMVLRATTDTSVVVTDLVEDTTYYWYVVPYDAQGRQGHSVPGFRSFSYDVNSPPRVVIPNPLLEVEPGDHLLEWEGMDDEGDTVTYDVYMDTFNGTALVAANIREARLTVELGPDLFYFWRVVPSDGLAIGEPASGIVVTGPAGTDVGASGGLLAPPDGAEVAPPVVNLTWQGLDILNRTLLYDLYVSKEGTDALSGPPFAVNLTSTWFQLEVVTGDFVTWAIEVHPFEGPSALLGQATFSVAVQDLELPVAVLRVGNASAGQAASSVAFAPLAFDASGSTSPEGGALEFWFDYGDGRASGWVDTPSVEHTYLEEGMYNATLRVRATNGTVSPPVLVVVEVSGEGPTDDRFTPGPTGLLSIACLLTAALLLGLTRRWPPSPITKWGDG